MPANPLPSPSQPPKPSGAPPAKPAGGSPVKPPPSAVVPGKPTQAARPLSPPPAPGASPAAPPPPTAPPGGKPPSPTPPSSPPPPPGVPPGAKPPSPTGAPPSPAGQPPAGKSPAQKAPGKPAKGQASGKPNQKKPANMASVKQSPFRFLPFIVGGIAIIGLVVFLITRVFGGSRQSVTPEPTAQPDTTTRKTVDSNKTTLNYWGLWEPDSVFTEVIDEFEAANPGVEVNYSKQSHKDYRERLQTAIASGSGPDLFRYHASWVPMLKNELAPLPQSVMTVTDFQQTFYPVAGQLQSNGQIVGIPLMYDGLALYYNTEILQAAGAEPPKTWAELRTLANKLTVKSSSGIERSGLAIGNASNVEHFSDILGLLMLQNGADVSSTLNSSEVRDALLFYTNFVKSDGVWDETLPSSTVAFARGDAAMMLAPSWRAHDVYNINPDLNYGIATLPKLGENRLTWATYWAEGVSAQSKNKELAWQLLDFMSSADNQKKMYSAASGIRFFGEIYSRQDLANDLAGNEFVAPFLSDAPYAQNWYFNSYTHDNGINDQLNKYLEDAVNAILEGQDMDRTLETLDQGSKQVLRQYGITQ